MGLELAPEDIDRNYQRGVWIENVPAVEAFLNICTQWRITGMADGGMHATGLDYTAAKVGLELANVTITPELWADIRLIELGARSAMNEG